MPRLGGTSGIGVNPAAPLLQLEAALGSTSAAVVWLAGVHSDASCQAAAEALSSAIGAPVADIKVMCQSVQRSGIVGKADHNGNRREQRRLDASSPSSPTSVLPSSSTSPKCGSGPILLLQRTGSVAPPCLRSSGASEVTPGHPPGFEASSAVASAALKPTTPLDVDNAPNIAFFPSAPALSALKILTPSQLVSPLLSSSRASADDDLELPLGFESYYTPATSPLARGTEMLDDWAETLTPLFADGSPARTPSPPRHGEGGMWSGSLSPVSAERVSPASALFVPVQPPLISPAPASSPRPPPVNKNRRKTFAAGYTVRRSSIRIRSNHRGLPIAKMAERNLCRRLGIVDGEEQVTEHAIGEFVCMFKKKLPSTAVAALRALF